MAAMGRGEVAIPGVTGMDRGMALGVVITTGVAAVAARGMAVMARGMATTHGMAVTGRGMTITAGDSTMVTTDIMVTTTTDTSTITGLTFHTFPRSRLAS